MYNFYLALIKAVHENLWTFQGRTAPIICYFFLIIIKINKTVWLHQFSFALVHQEQLNLFYLDFYLRGLRKLESFL